MLSVVDTGIGMDAATTHRIFEPFFTTKPKGQGTGLGLATVFGIVQQSRGQVLVTSAVGKGTVFDVYFPRTDATAEVAAPDAPSLEQRGTETILLVEDDAQVRALMAAILRRAGYTVFEARDPMDALAQGEQRRDHSTCW